MWSKPVSSVFHGFCFIPPQFSALTSLLTDCDVDMSDEINPFLPELLLVMMFIDLRSSLLPWSLAFPLHRDAGRITLGNTGRGWSTVNPEHEDSKTRE